ncbi:hypothetical protein P9112_007665 [Eukaryota sp. TZLM1-RC]
MPIQCISISGHQHQLDLPSSCSGIFIFVLVSATMDVSSVTCSSSSMCVTLCSNTAHNCLTNSVSGQINVEEILSSLQSYLTWRLVSLPLQSTCTSIMVNISNETE